MRTTFRRFAGIALFVGGLVAVACEQPQAPITGGNSNPGTPGTDTTSTKRDTTSTPRDTTSTSRDTTSTPRDTTSTPRDTTRPPPPPPPGGPPNEPSGYQVVTNWA